jgi:DNA-directed RNA polymerase subunit E'/Rpb7
METYHCAICSKELQRDNIFDQENIPNDTVLVICRECAQSHRGAIQNKSDRHITMLDITYQRRHSILGEFFKDDYEIKAITSFLEERNGKMENEYPKAPCECCGNETRDYKNKQLYNVCVSCTPEVSKLLLKPQNITPGGNGFFNNEPDRIAAVAKVKSKLADKVPCACCDILVTNQTKKHNNGGEYFSTCGACGSEVVSFINGTPIVSDTADDNAFDKSISDRPAAIETIRKKKQNEKLITKDKAMENNNNSEKMQELIKQLEALQASNSPDDLKKVQELTDKLTKENFDQASLDKIASLSGSNKAPNLQKRELAARVLEALKENGFPYGEFLRQTLGFEDFDRVTFYTPQKDPNYPIVSGPFGKATDKIKSIDGLTITSISDIIYKGNNASKTYTITDKASNISIDLNVSKQDTATVENDSFASFIQSDLDAIFIDKNNEMQAAPGYSLEAIVKNLSAKRFTPSDNATTDYIKKMQDKGFILKEAKQVDKSTLKVGDKVSIRIVAPNEKETLRTGTVFSINDQSVKVLLSEKYAGEAGQSWVVSDAKQKETLKSYSLETSEPLGWDISLENTEVISVLEHIHLKLDPNSLRLGQKVKLHWHNNKQDYHGVGLVIKADGANSLLAIEGGGIFSDKNNSLVTHGMETSNSQRTMIEAFDADVNKYKSVGMLTSGVSATEVISNLSIDRSSLAIGDKVQIEVNLKEYRKDNLDQFETREATIIGKTSDKFYLAVDNVLVTGDGLAKKPGWYLKDYPEFHNEAKYREVPNLDQQIGFTAAQNNANVRFLSLLQKGKANLDLKSLEVGKVYSVELHGKYAAAPAIVIEKDALGVPTLAFKTVPSGYSASYPTDQQKTLLQKYGVIEGYCIAKLDSNTKVRTEIETAPSFIPHKEVTIGDKISCSINNQFTVSGIVAEINSSGPLLVIPKTAGISTSEATKGVYANAAAVLGPDVNQYGVYPLNAAYDFITEKQNKVSLDSISFSDVSPGDIVEIEIIAPELKMKATALVAVKHNDSSKTLSLVFTEKKDIAVACSGASKTMAEKYGFETEGTAYNISSSFAVIRKNLGKAALKAISPAKLKVGDRVNVAFNHEHNGVAVVIEDAETSIFGEPIVAFETENAAFPLWNLSDEQKKIASDYGLTGNKIGRRIDGTSTIVTSIVGRKNILPSKFAVGDKVLLSTPAYPKATPFPNKGTIISIDASNKSATFLLDESYRDETNNLPSSQLPSAAQLEAANALKLNSNASDARYFEVKDGNGWLDCHRETTKKAEKKSEIKVNNLSLQEGDRVRFKISGVDNVPIEGKATVLGTSFNGFPLMFADEELKKGFLFEQEKNINAVRSLGLDPKKRSGWEANTTKVEIVEVLEKHSIAIEKLKIGDRILLDFKEDGISLASREAIYLGMDNGSCHPTAYLLEGIDISDHSSWKADEHSTAYIAAANLNLDKLKSNFINLDDFVVPRKIVNFAENNLTQEVLDNASKILNFSRKEIKEEEEVKEPEEEKEEKEKEDDENQITPWDCEVGDKISLQITNPDTEEMEERIGTILDLDHDDGPVIALDEPYEKDGIKSINLKSLGSTIVRQAKKFNINPEKKVAWNFDDYTKIIKVVGKAAIVATVAKSITNKENETMPTNSSGDDVSLLDELKENLSEAAWRTTSKKMIEAAKTVLVNILKTKMNINENSDALRFLDSTLGEAFLGGVVGMALIHIPQMKDNVQVQKLAREFRTNSFSVVTGEVMDIFMSSFMPLANDLLKQIPAVEELTSVGKKQKKGRIAPPRDEASEETVTSSGSSKSNGVSASSAS